MKSYILGALVGILNICLAFINLNALLVFWVILAAILIYLEVNNHGK